jgi:hypothetical protein
VVVSCEHGDEPTGSMKGEGLLHQLRFLRRTLYCGDTREERRCSREVCVSVFRRSLRRKARMSYVEVMTVMWYQLLNSWTDIHKNQYGILLLTDVGEFQFSADLVYSCNKYRIT